jgi:hypothetical protein
VSGALSAVALADLASPAVKDRSWARPLDSRTRILVTRSSVHPVTYAITLVTEHDGQEQAVRTYDNAHAVDEHHVHGYIGAQKQQPTVMIGDVNQAMSDAMADLMANWHRYVEDWKLTFR